MKAMRQAFAKGFAVLMAAVLAVGLAFAGLAASGPTTPAFAAADGSITISNPTNGQTYKVYKLFDATYATTGEGDDATTIVSYTYTKTGDNDALYTALTADDSVFTLAASAANSSVYVVTVKEGKENADVIAYVKSIADKLGDPVATKKAESKEVKFENLDYGYYYVTSTLGTLVTIDSALKDVTIQDKNTAPSNVKTVEEDSDSSWGDSNTADLGDTVNFQSTIMAYEGAAGYVLHDTMSAGLTFDSTSVKVAVGTTELTAYVAPAEGEDEPTNWDYKVVTPGTETGEGVTACTFEIAFSQTYLDTITGTTENPTTIVISYSAKVNENAVIGGEGNPNSSSLQYSNATETTKTPDSTTTTYVWTFDLHKYANDDTTGYLADAEFVLSSGTGDDVKYATFSEITTTTGEGDDAVTTVVGYKLTGWASSKDNATHIVTNDSTAINIEGLDADDYELTEVKAPDGYNLLDAAVTVTIDQEGKVTVGTGTDAVTEVAIQNQSGTALPSTGGIGTTIFYIVGGILVVGAAIALIVKRRMTHLDRDNGDVA